MCKLLICCILVYRVEILGIDEHISDIDTVGILLKDGTMKISAEVDVQSVEGAGLGFVKHSAHYLVLFYYRAADYTNIESVEHQSVGDLAPDGIGELNHAVVAVHVITVVKVILVLEPEESAVLERKHLDVELRLLAIVLDGPLTRLVGVGFALGVSLGRIIVN